MYMYMYLQSLGFSYYVNCIFCCHSSITYLYKFYWFHWDHWKEERDSETQKYCSCLIFLSILIQERFFSPTCKISLCVFYLKYLNPTEIFFHSFFGLFDYVLCLFSRIIFI